MIAGFIVNPGKIEIREIKTPEPSDGEILVKIKVALTCGTDLKAYKYGHTLIPMPGRFGHEFSGIIAGVGKGVKRFKEGDEIMSVHSAPCLECLFCKKKVYNLCQKIMDTKILGAFAEYIVIPSYIVKQNVFQKPKHISFEEAAFLEPLSCVVHGVENLCFDKGESVLIMGAGPIGLLHLLLLKDKGVTVAITDRHINKLNLARKLGADFIYKSPLSLGQRKRIGIGFDYVFECTGKIEVWEASIDYVRKGGIVVLFGGCPAGTRVTYDTGRIHYDEITLKGVFHYTPHDVKRAYKILSTKRLNVSGLISGRYSLKNIQKAFDKLIKGEGIKYAIMP